VAKAQSTAGLCYPLVSTQSQRQAKGSRMPRGCDRRYRWLGNSGSGPPIGQGTQPQVKTRVDEKLGAIGSGTVVLGNSHLDRGPRTLVLGNGAPGRMFDASLERLSVTETSYNNSLAERVPRSTIQTLPATLPEPWSEARGPRSVIKKPQGPVPRSATVDLS